MYAGEWTSAARRARKALQSAGFSLFKVHGRYKPFCNEQTYTWGVNVSRVGCSNAIALHARASKHASVSEDRELFTRALEALRAAGLAFDDKGWLYCSRKS